MFEDIQHTRNGVATFDLKEEIMSTKISDCWEKREKPVVRKSTIPEEAVRNSPFIIKKIEQAKRRLREHPFPIELLKER